LVPLIVHFYKYSLPWHCFGCWIRLSYRCPSNHVFVLVLVPMTFLLWDHAGPPRPWLCKRLAGDLQLACQDQNWRPRNRQRVIQCYANWETIGWWPIQHHPTMCWTEKYTYLNWVFSSSFGVELWWPIRLKMAPQFWPWIAQFIGQAGKYLVYIATWLSYAIIGTVITIWWFNIAMENHIFFG
jgi:hypothetical protein